MNVPVILPYREALGIDPGLGHTPSRPELIENSDYYYDVELPINHVISKAVLHLVAICITKHRRHKLKVCRKFSKIFLTFILLFLLFAIKVENNDKFCSKVF